MKKMLTLISIILLSCVISNFLEKNKRRYYINLDDSLEAQYSFISERKEDVHRGVKLTMDNFAKFPQIVDYYNQNYETILKNQNKDFLNRIDVIAKLAEVNAKDLLLINISYELFCTSAVIKNQNDGIIFMGRNYDLVHELNEDFANLHKDISYEAYFYKHHKLQFVGQGLLGVVGLLNGVKVGKFGVSFNKRNKNRNPIKSLQNIINGDLESLFVVTQALYYDNSYEEVVKRFTDSQIATVCYYIASGVNKNEGAIISRDPHSVTNIETLDEDNGKWYLVQTNSDRDEYCERRDFAEKNLNIFKEKHSVNYDNVLYKILSVPPSKMTDTIFSTVMTADKRVGLYLNSIYWEKSK